MVYTYCRVVLVKTRAKFHVRQPNIFVNCIQSQNPVCDMPCPGRAGERESPTPKRDQVLYMAMLQDGRPSGITSG